MSQESVHAVRKAFDAFVRRDVDAALEIMDSEIDLIVPETQARVRRQDSYRGHEGIRRYFEDVKEAWLELEVFLHEFHDIDDRVLVVGRVRARGKDGLLIDQPAQWAWRIRNGKIVWGQVFTDRDKAYEAVGLRP